MSKETFPKLNLIPAEEDLIGWDISVLVYTEMGFDASPCFAIVCVVFTPVFAVIGNGSGICTTSFFAVVIKDWLSAPKKDFVKLAMAVPIPLKKLPIFFQNIPLESE